MSFMLSATKQAFMLGVFMLNVVMLSVFMLSVVAPTSSFSFVDIFDFMCPLFR